MVDDAFRAKVAEWPPQIRRIPTTAGLVRGEE